MSVVPAPVRGLDVRRLVADNPAIVLTFVFVGLFVATDVVNRVQSGQAFLTPKQVSTTFLYAAVLGLLAAGQPNQAIAEELVISLDTVKRHVSHVLDKLGAANRTQAVARARELGVLR